VGLAKKQTDTVFCQFETMEMGWRAAFVLLTRTYYHTYHLFTISKIIRRWAPGNENNTNAYINSVSEMMNYGKDEPLGVPSFHSNRWFALALAMAKVENGDVPYPCIMAAFRGWEMRG
jgi:hypothetical protein